MRRYIICMMIGEKEIDRSFACDFRNLFAVWRCISAVRYYCLPFLRYLWRKTKIFGLHEKFVMRKRRLKGI